MPVAILIAGFLKSSISLKQNVEIASLFACWYNFTEIKSLLKSIGLGMVKTLVWPLWWKGFKNGYIEKRDRLNWLFAFWYKIRKTKSLHYFWGVVVIIGHGHLSDISQEWIDELGQYFGCWYNCRKSKSCFN